MSWSALRIEEIKGQGRSVIASQPLKAGQIILRDSPILLYSAHPLIPNHHHYNNYCSHCFKLIYSQLPLLCPSCSLPFCTPNCHSEATATSHTHWACRALLRLRDFPNWSSHLDDLQVQARFLVAAYNLVAVSPSGFGALMSLQGKGGAKEEENGTAFFLHSLLASSVFPIPDGFGGSFSVETTAALLAKDKLNAFGLMEPFVAPTSGGTRGTSPFRSDEQQVQQHRSVRAYGIYPNASLFNHDCLPNACRFDYIDHNNDASSSSKTNTEIVIRMIHDVPEGREICLSYFPVNLNYRDRQLRLRDDYGFICSCDRCQVEANWSFSDDDENDEVAMDDEDDKDDELMEAASEEEEEQDGNDKENDFPHAYFFSRYMCTQQDCWGTLAPLPTPPSSNGIPPLPSSFRVMTMECNVCGNLKNDEQQEVTDCQP